MHDARTRAIVIVVLSFAIFAAEFALYSLHTDAPYENLRNISYHYDTDWRRWITSQYYPPFWDYFWHVFHTAFGVRYAYASIMNATFILLGAALVYLLLALERVSPDFAAAGFAMTLISPTALIASVRMRPESMMWFLLIGFIYFLVRSRTFTLIKESVLASVFVSLGLLSKWSFFGYSFLPALIESLTPTRKPARKLFGLLAFAITGLILCGPWYLGVMEPERILPSATNDPNLPVYSFKGMIKVNLHILVNIIWGYPQSGFAFVLILAAMILCRSRTLWLLAGSVAGTIVFFSIPSHTEERYLWPLVPVLAAATALAAAKLRARFGKGRILPTALVCLAILNSVYMWHLLAVDEGFDAHKILARATYSIPKRSYQTFHSFLSRSREYVHKRYPYIAVFPPLSLYLLDWGYPEYLNRLHPEPVPYRISHLDLSIYWEFQDELHQLKHDAIVMDCGQNGDCDEAFEAFLKHDLHRLRVPYYQPGLKEDEVKIFDPESVIEDYELIKKHYRPVAFCEPYPEHIFVMWIKNELLE